MELGLTFPLQRFLKTKTPAYGTEPDRRFAGICMSSTCGGANACWLFTVTAGIRLSDTMWRPCSGQIFRDCSGRDWLRVWPPPDLIQIRSKTTCGGQAVSRLPVPMAAGRWRSLTGPGRMCWQWICVWTQTARRSPCWTTRSIPGWGGVRALRDWEPDGNGLRPPCDRTGTINPGGYSHRIRFGCSPGRSRFRRR